jgi:hypothetical protein
MSVGHWNMHGALKVVIELNLYGSVINKGLRMHWKTAIEHIVCERGAPLRGLIRVCWHLESEDCHMLFKAIEEFVIDFRLKFKKLSMSGLKNLLRDEGY